jgi:hypothetical protein
MKPELPDETRRLMADLDQALPLDSDDILPVASDPMIGAARRLAEGPDLKLSDAALNHIEARLRARTVEACPVRNTQPSPSIHPALSYLADQIHPDDLKRLTQAQHQPRALHRPEVQAQAGPKRAQPTNGRLRPVNWDADVERLLAEKKRQREARRMKAHGRLLAQKRKRLMGTGDLVVIFQILLLLVGTLIERIIYDLARWKRAFDHQPARARGLQLITYAALILLVVGFIFAGEVITYVQGQRGPFLAAALASPYDLDTRPAPFIDEYGQITLPASFEGYKLVNSDPEGVSISRINRCLVGLRVDYTSDANAYCPRTYGALSVAYGRYMDRSNSPVDIVVSNFKEKSHADQTFRELLRYSRSISQVGNFSLLDDDTADYFYAVSTSEFHRWITFAWQRGSVIYMISAQDSGRVEAAVNAFPY